MIHKTMRKQYYSLSYDSLKLGLNLVDQSTPNNLIS